MIVTFPSVQIYINDMMRSHSHTSDEFRSKTRILDQFHNRTQVLGKFRRDLSNTGFARKVDCPFSFPPQRPNVIETLPGLMGLHLPEWSEGEAYIQKCVFTESEHKLMEFFFRSSLEYSQILNCRRRLFLVECLLSEWPKMLGEKRKKDIRSHNR